MKRTRNVFRQPLGLVHLGHPFGEALKHLDVVHLLKRIAVAVIPRHLPDEHDHRRRIVFRYVDAGRRVRRPRPACDEQHPRLARQFPVRLGHDRGTAFLPADDVLDPRLIQPVERGEEAFARHGKHPPHALYLELIDENLAAVTHGHLFLNLPPRRLVSYQDRNDRRAYV